jgi:hypothetical protein
LLFLRRFSYHGSLQVALASPETLTQPIPVAQPAARPLALGAAQTALAQPAARALAVPLPVAVAAAPAAPVAVAAVAVTATAAALAEPAPWHATTTSATTTKKSRRAGQPPLRGQSEL